MSLSGLTMTSLVIQIIRRIIYIMGAKKSLWVHFLIINLRRKAKDAISYKGRNYFISGNKTVRK
jgi:hypothetical protein